MRLIDADALGIGKARRDAFLIPEYADGWNSAIEHIENAPTIDIKTEVAREIFAEISKRFETLLKDYPCNGDGVSAKKFLDVHWEYISNSIMSDYDTKLKNKYILRKRILRPLPRCHNRGKRERR